MAKERKPVHKVVMTEGKRDIIRQLLQEYDIQTAEDIQDALKDLLGGTIKEMMEAEYRRCLVHQVRNTLKYAADKDRKPFVADLKRSTMRLRKKTPWNPWNRSRRSGAPNIRIP